MNSRTIRTPGSSVERVSQACDRCRAKKVRCDGKKPCSQCIAVGFDCKISDKLSRRAFPRGYTETLEERVRELELENKKLVKMIDLKNEEVNIVTKNDANNGTTNNESTTHNEMTLLTDENLKAFNSSSTNGAGATTASHSHHDGTPCFCSNYPHSVHERPVSIAGSVDFNDSATEDEAEPYGSHHQDINHFSNNPLRKERARALNAQQAWNNNNNLSFEQVNAPGAMAAISLQKKAQNQNFINLSTLVAMSVPRTTAETLFIPSLLAKICNVHGFNSKAAISTAKSIAGLKENYQDIHNNQNTTNYANFSFKMINFNKITRKESVSFFQSLNLPNQVNLDLFITNFFNNWNKVIPILNKQQFLNKYLKFNKSRESNFEDELMYGDEKFAETLILMITLVMLSQERHNSSIATATATATGSSASSSASDLPQQQQQAAQATTIDNDTLPPPPQAQPMKKENSPKMFKDNSNFEILQYYNHIIHEFIRSDMSHVASLTSIQNLCLELLYCLSVGDLGSSYDIRGKLITMGQQLRLHRCPSAVLGNNGSTVSQLQQGERRILFWCTYVLDTFSALILGVPRLLKDFEIECALPFSNEAAAGDVATFATTTQQQQQQQNTGSGGTGNDINDTNMVIINNNKLSLVGKVCNLALAVMRYAKILGNVVDFIFKRSGGNGGDEDFSLMSETLLDHWKKNLPMNLNFDSIDTTKVDLYTQLDEQQLLMVFLYHYCKILIYLPNLSKEIVISKSSSTYIIIQQSTSAILNIANVLSSQAKNFYYLPLPFNFSREKVRIALLFAKGSLEYTRGGALFQESKNLLQSIINDLKIENGIGMLGCLSDSCIDNLDSAIENILSLPLAKRSAAAAATATAAAPSGVGSSVAAAAQKKQINNSPLKNDITMEDADTIFKVPSPPNALQQQQRGTSRKQQQRAMQQQQQQASSFQQPSPNTYRAQVSPSQLVQQQQQSMKPQQAAIPAAHIQVQPQPLPTTSTKQYNFTPTQQQQAFANGASVDMNPIEYNDGLIDFTVDGSLGLNSLLDFDFDFGFTNTFGNTNTQTGMNNTDQSAQTPNTTTSNSTSSANASLFSWQQPQQQ